MNILRLIAIYLLLTSCTSQSNNTTPLLPENHLISYSELLSVQEKFSPILLDVRKEKEFNQGHIPMAQNVWRPDIRDLENTIEGLIPSKEQMEILLSKLGVTEESIIVIYDGKGNPDAVRLWWILYYYGHKKCYILDGGFNPKTKATTDIHIPTPTQYTFKSGIDSSLYASKKDMLNAINDTNYIIIDTRCMKEYSGIEKKRKR